MATIIAVEPESRIIETIVRSCAISRIVARMSAKPRIARGRTTSDASRFSLGGGVELGHVHLDYAYQAFDLLGGATHRVGLRWTP